MSGAGFVVGGWFASAVIDKFVDKAAVYLGDNHALHAETKEMLNNLKNTLPEMQAIMEEAEKQKIQNKGIIEWLKLIKDAAYEAEDVLDDFEAKNICEDLKGKGKVRKAASSIAKGAKNLILPDDDVRKLKAVVNKLEQLCKQSSTFVGLLKLDLDRKGNCLASTESGDVPPFLPHDQPFFGRDSEIKLILSMILGYEVELLEHEARDRVGKIVIERGASDRLGKRLLKRNAWYGTWTIEQITSSQGSTQGAEAKPIQEQGIGEGSKSSQTKSGHYGRPHVIPIVGISGVGKTALAQIIYSHPLLEGHFDLKKWFYMSQKSDVYKMVKAFVPYVCSNPSNVTKNLIRNIKGMRFLLVLDDICTEVCSELEKVLPCFNVGAYGSVILVTTQEHSISDILGTIGPINLNPLGLSYFLPLLEYYTFKNANITKEKREALKPLCTKIGMQLHGIPQAAKIVGDMLRSNIDIEYWEHISRNSRRYCNNVFSFLEIAYQHLDANLKQCFAFCSTFPANYIIERDRIIQMWIANNFIQLNSSNEPRSEDIGKMWFNKLVNISFFLPTPWPHKYIMNRAIRELAVAIFFNEVFIFYENPNPCLYGCFLWNENLNPCSHGYSVIDNDQRTIPPSTRYLTVRTKKPTINLGACSDKLRTLLFYSDYYESSVVEQENKRIHLLSRFRERHFRKQINSDSILSSTGKLRVLQLSYPGDGVEKHIDAICQLLHLRFMDLSFTGITELPEAICSLYHLQVLDVRGGGFEKLPKNMNHLINLRHLYASNETISLVSGIGKLTNLQELEEFRITNEEGHTISELAEMNEIGARLSILSLGNVKNEVDALEAKLEEKTHLKALSVNWDYSYPYTCIGSSRDRANKILNSLKPHVGLEKLEIENYPGTELPSWTTLTLVNIRYIYLGGCTNVGSIPPLGQLSYLETLILNGLPFECIGEELYGPGQVIFPALKVLKFVGMKQWSVWSPAAERELFPRLEELEIRDCYYLKQTPLCSLELSSLKVLELSDCEGVLEEGSISDKQLPLLTYLCISRSPPINLSYHNLPNLRVLSLKSSDVEFKGGQQTLSNLKSLILDYSHVRWNGEPALPFLTKLKMQGFLRAIGEIVLLSLPSLKVLEISCSSTDHRTYIDLNTWLQKLPHLVELSLGSYTFEEIPSTIADLISLKSLSISINTISGIQSLPERGMPPYLRELYIYGASKELKNRCSPEQGEDWQKIAHIPYIRVNNETLQML